MTNEEVVLKLAKNRARVTLKSALSIIGIGHSTFYAQFKNVKKSLDEIEKQYFKIIVEGSEKRPTYKVSVIDIIDYLNRDINKKGK